MLSRACPSMTLFAPLKSMPFFNLLPRNFMTESNNESRRFMVMSEIMTPNMVNFHGNVHGGHGLIFLDRVAYACAARYACKNVVTLSVDQVVFKEPIFVGE